MIDQILSLTSGFFKLIVLLLVAGGVILAVSAILSSSSKNRKKKNPTYKSSRSRMGVDLGTKWVPRSGKRPTSGARPMSGTGPTSKPTSKPAKSGPVTRAQIQKLYDPQDTRIKSSSQQQQVVSNVRTYQRKRQVTVSTQGTQERISVDLSWSENLDELLEATEVIYSNAEMSCGSPMQSARFDYYRNLHYRSYMAADLCQSKIVEITPQYDYINRTIARLNNREDPLHVSRSDYQEIVQIKDGMKAILALLRTRRDTLNTQTGTLRDKIGTECGRGGAEWRAKIMARHTH